MPIHSLFDTVRDHPDGPRYDVDPVTIAQVGLA